MKQSRMEDAGHKGRDFMQVCIAFGAYILFCIAVTRALEPFIGVRASLMPLVLQGLPFAVGLPAVVIWVGRKEGWHWALALGVLISPAIMYGMYETASYGADVVLPLEERRVDVTRIYFSKRKGFLNSEWRLVDDRGHSYKFPPYVEPQVPNGPLTVRMSHFRHRVLSVQRARPTR